MRIILWRSFIGAVRPSINWSRGLRVRLCLRLRGFRTILRPEQGPLQKSRLQDLEDRALRHLLLSERAPGRRHRGKARRTLACATRTHVRAQAEGPPTALDVRVAYGF